MGEDTAGWVGLATATSVWVRWLRGLSMEELADVSLVEAQARKVARACLEESFEAWAEVLEERALDLALTCPGCGGLRRCKRREDDPLVVEALGLRLELPKLYLWCANCDAPGVSITRLLTGLASGDTSNELELTAAYCAANVSYGKASQELEVHHGQAVERTKVRRMALEVEEDAKRFAEAERQEHLAELSKEGRREGPECLVVQGDGGRVRTGTLVPCQPGDSGYGQKTVRRGSPRRKREEQGREIITLDVREPGQMTVNALDVLVPATAPPGAREDRMLALAARAKLGDDTEVIGLGDLGSGLPAAFDEAFHDYEGFYSGDWHHLTDYIEKAAEVLQGLDPKKWTRKLKGAIWNRRRKQAQALIDEARAHRLPELPEWVEKCPVAVLQTYVHNNWDRFRAKALHDRGYDFVSARAESQVRDRTKSRFAVPGAWRTETLEGKATLRAIVGDGRWHRFKEHYRATKQRAFREGLKQRLHDAVAAGRLGDTPLAVSPSAPRLTEEALAA